MSHVCQPKTGGLKQLYLRAADPAAEHFYTPRLYVEARIDFADVRSGLKGTRSVSNALEFYPFDGDDLWTSEMITAVDPVRVETVPPGNARFAPLPPALLESTVVDVEARLLSYLLGSNSVTLLKNSALNVYSTLAESKADFCSRCLEMLKEPFRRELDVLLNTFNRGLEQIHEKHFKDDSWTAFDRSRVAAQNRGVFRDAVDRITYLFINTELTLQEQPPEPRKVLASDLSGRLAALELEARHALGKLVACYQEKALAVDEYIVHPNFRDIHLVRSCILWMPEER